MTREEYNQNPNQCLCCGNKILCQQGQKLSEIRQKKFCNQSCAAKYNNSKRIREKKAYYCQECGALIGRGYEEFGRRKFCDKCNPSYKDWSTITYGEAKSLRKYQANSRIRDLARVVFQKEKGYTSCYRCGYDKHIEVCHIHGISEFSDDTPISVINNPDNLIGLCPNCHWELDYGDLTIEKIFEEK